VQCCCSKSSLGSELAIGEPAATQSAICATATLDSQQTTGDQVLSSLDTPSMLTESTETLSCAVQTDLTASDIAVMEQTVSDHYLNVYIDSLDNKSVNIRPFHMNNFVNDDSKVKYYTGLTNYKLLVTIFEFTQPYVNRGKSLSQFVVILAKLRLNLGLQDLAYRVNTSVATISRIILKWIRVLDERLSPVCIIWPERAELRKTMPLCFKQSFGSKVAVIVDCFEIFIDRPSNVLARAETWSQYKHHNTVKFLIGITPQGTVSFISSGWGGRVSDKQLTQQSGLLNNLLPGDVVLADRGFTIQESVSLMGATLHMPAFTKGRDQLSALEVEASRAISNVRIHVERVIGLVRQKYTILNGPLAIQFLYKRSEESIPLIDRMVHVCCCLSNVCDSIVPLG